MDAYFRLLHHPLETQGVDFWWMDWQQQRESAVTGLDPLWWLNHLHFLDMQRDPQRRPLIFSRWGGLGNHRYPVGFSGDSFVSWKSLDFQPYFTATAANVCYHWWSHDIGGYLPKSQDRELYTRWIQCGALSPILRLHSHQASVERLPWKYDPETFAHMKRAMRFRHELIPYLYCLAWRSHTSGDALAIPMYHVHPECEEAYCCPGQYYFGRDIIAAPHTSRANAPGERAQKNIWLPDGIWFDFFSGKRHHGNAWHTRFGGLDDMPLYARAGAIIPLNGDIDHCKIGNPSILALRVFPGAGHFDLYEDDGESQACAQGDCHITRCDVSCENGGVQLLIKRPESIPGYIPAERTYRIELVGVPAEARISIHVDDRQIDTSSQVDPATGALVIEGIPAGTHCRIHAEPVTPVDASPSTLLQELIRSFRVGVIAEQQLLAIANEIPTNILLLEKFAGALSRKEMMLLAEASGHIGAAEVPYGGGRRFIAWCNPSQPEATVTLSGHRDSQFLSETKPIGSFICIDPRAERLGDWQIHFRFGKINDKIFRHDDV